MDTIQWPINIVKFSGECKDKGDDTSHFWRNSNPGLLLLPANVLPVKPQPLSQDVNNVERASNFLVRRLTCASKAEKHLMTMFALKSTSNAEKVLVFCHQDNFTRKL